MLSSCLISGCGSKEVKCMGVSKDTPDLGLTMSKGACEKIAGSQIMDLSPEEQQVVQPYPFDSYVKCYGVAAASMNDCGTKSSACGGSVSVARSSDAWIALPKGVCQQLKGGQVELPASS